MSSGSGHEAFVPGFKYDVFVSYAGVDDRPLIPSEPGWVTNLVQKISTLLGQELGGEEVFKLWMDRKQVDGLAGNEPIQEKIRTTVESTAVLIVIMSPAYLKRDWCQFELDAFADAIERVKLTNGRIFIVEREKIEQMERPPELRNLRGYRFWVDEDGERERTLGIPIPTADERQYWTELSGLANELSKQLQELKSVVPDASQATEVVVKTDDRPSVFLAEATDDLYHIRKQVVDYLDQAGLRVVPAATEHYPFEEEPFRAAVQRDLAACDSVCVQLLSDVGGRYQKFVMIQNELAAASGKTLLQWRSRDLDLDHVDDTQLRDLLDNETVLAVGIEEFKKTIVERAQSAARAPDRPANATFVRISGNAHDNELLDAISEILERNQVNYDRGEMDDLQEELEYVFEYCDGMIIPYANSSVKEVEHRLRACRMHMFRHKRKPLLAVCQAASDKPSPGISMPGMQIVKGGLPLSEQAVLKFIDDVQRKVVKKDRSAHNPEIKEF